jgi:hypothetical protein
MCQEEEEFAMEAVLLKSNNSADCASAVSRLKNIII